MEKGVSKEMVERLWGRLRVDVAEIVPVLELAKAVLEGREALERAMARWSAGRWDADKFRRILSLLDTGEDE